MGLLLRFIEADPWGMDSQKKAPHQSQLILIPINLYLHSGFLWVEWEEAQKMSGAY